MLEGSPRALNGPSLAYRNSVHRSPSKDRVDDSRYATRSAAEEGVVLGGDVALARASTVLSHIVAENDDHRAGTEIFRKSIQTPLRRIAENASEAGLDDASRAHLDKRLRSGETGGSLLRQTETVSGNTIALVRPVKTIPQAEVSIDELATDHPGDMQDMALARLAAVRQNVRERVRKLI